MDITLPWAGQVTQSVSLWPVFHDARLRGVESDPFDGSANVTISHWGFNMHYGYEHNAEYCLHFEKTYSVEALIGVAYDAPVNEHGGKVPLRRYESASWAVFEQRFSDEYEAAGRGLYCDGRYEVVDAILSKVGDLYQVTIEEIIDLRSGDPDAEELTQLRIVAEDISILGPRGKLALADYLAMGVAYHSARSEE